MVVMVPRASIIFESEVSITVLCLRCSSCYTAVRIKNRLKSMSVIKVATMMVPHTPELKYPFPFFVSYVQLITQQYELCKGSHHVQPPINVVSP